MSKSVRTRFAPSPTGFLHVGGIRTALFAWLVARQNKGAFVLRLEDTDKKREVAGSEQHVINSLRALCLDYDEGPDIGGPYAPYRQSERLDTYLRWANKLIEKGRAYADPYTPEEVQMFREKARQEKRPFLYREHRPENPPEWDGKQPLRFQSDPKAYEWDDSVTGAMHAGAEAIDDFILIKSDGYPTYNFAHIIDDLEMKNSHVIRGQEFLASMPNYLNLYEALGIDPPFFATMPHILAPGGNKKLSKRDGAKDVLDYIREGYVPEALRNFIASLGWNDGTEQEIFTTDELVKNFSLERVQRSGAHFDERRLQWMNGVYIREKLGTDDLYAYATGNNYFKINYWPKEAAQFDDSYCEAVLALSKERLKFLAELPELTKFFFIDLPIEHALISGDKQLKKIPNEDLAQLLKMAQTTLEQSDFSAEDLTDRLNKLLEVTGQKPAILFSLIRIATTQAAASPPLAASMAVLGKERSLARLAKQLETLVRVS